MNWLGILISLLYIGLIVGISSILVAKEKFDVEVSRKFIHIGLCNWWLIAWIFFDNPFFASILPCFFIILNLYSNKTRLIRAMERDNDKSLGTVWYSTALFILSLIFFTDRNNLMIGALAILILGYGDGLTGLLGKVYGKHKFWNKKTLEGSLIMFFVSFIVSYLMLNIFIINHILLFSFIIGVFSMFIEMIFTKGYDNLFIPLGISVIIYYLLNTPLFYVFAFVLAVNIMIVTLAYGFSLLTLGGAIMALIIGFITYYYGGFYSYVALILFFTLGNILKKFNKEEKGPRNYKQVLANGFISTIFVIIYSLTLNKMFLIGFFVAIAGACSDTLSGDLGLLSKEKTKYLVSRKVVAKGISGGVTKLGFLGGILGSLIISLVSLLKFNLNIAIIIFVLGFMTTIIDSFLGEFYQVLYIDKNKKKFEQFDKKYKIFKGYKFMTNNMVNFISILVTSIVGVLIGLI